ncbi:NAD(P)H-quinone oxidoreductase subunit I, chloroplastic [Fundidesulfovibrio magnetotacticus]|uniref:NAD(P)H-quinone oxidoreductase subunit I, chloroplastic n=1 Tax=Fundidesulfovibrio magnetotacticus TaxID=2730080 RepID=A0A6V8LTG7_9BACT|nr:nitroreductase family protein [Fundidesulfovibrio magnetotacticus]GFK93618.1 NAD(P)H-quinone oxidoreductase subunit I, chloroplastic [Fundidesulfovibrio magnetotacticus]
MTLITVDQALCARDGICRDVCPVGCIDMDRASGLPQETPDPACIACGHCVAACPHGALSNSQVDAAACLRQPTDLPGEASLRSLLLARRSVRAYRRKPVERSLLAELLETARRAPTASNSQHVHWIACADKDRVHEMAQLGARWMRAVGLRPRLVELWDKGRDVVMRGAPAFVGAWTPADYPWGAVDSSIALTYLELHAATAGLGACWAGLLTAAARQQPELRALLGLQDGQTLHGGLMLGWPRHAYRLVPPRREARVAWV